MMNCIKCGKFSNSPIEVCGKVYCCYQCAFPPTTPTQPEVRLEEIKKRCEAAKEGPWEQSEYDEDGGEIIGPKELHICFCNSHRTGEFIAHARTDIPALIAMVEGYKKAFEDEIEGNRTLAMSMGEMKPGETFRAFCKRVAEERDSLRERVEGLKAALQLEHPSTCAFMSQELLPCDCGVAEARHKAMHPPKTLADLGEVK